MNRFWNGLIILVLLAGIGFLLYIATLFVPSLALLIWGNISKILIGLGCILVFAGLCYGIGYIAEKLGFK
jgi:hypothetical protein